MRKILWVLVIVLLLLGATFLLQRREEQSERAERADARLLLFDDREVSAIVLTAGGTAWRFERDSDGWHLVEPVVDAVNEEAIEDLMMASRRTTVARVIEDPEALSAYGLDPPVASIRLEGVHAPVLDLGDITPTEEGIFARVEGRPGVLVLGDMGGLGAHLVRPEPVRFRDPELLGVGRSDIVGLEMSGSAGAISLEREQDGWWIIRPRRLPASDLQVGRLLQALEEAEVKGFFDDANPGDPALGLQDAALRIQVRSSSSTVRVLVLGSDREEDYRFVTRDDRETVLAVNMAPLDSLPLDVNSLIADRLSRVNRYQVRRFLYRYGEDELVAMRVGEQWTSGDGESIPEDEVYAFLVRVLELPISGWRESRASRASTTGRLEYQLQNGQEGRIDFLPGAEARVSWAPGVVYGLSGSPPSVPRFP